MDCNRDEALRSKHIAELRFAQQDYVSARRFALKAVHLFSPLGSDLEQFIAVLDVHAVAQQKLHSGLMDWYAILQSQPSADDASLRKQYRKLALALHPDKNKAAGADAAFKLLSEAWSVVSDKTRRAAYDMKRAAAMMAAKQTTLPPPSSSSSSSPSSSSGAAKPSAAPQTGNACAASSAANQTQTQTQTQNQNQNQNVARRSRASSARKNRNAAPSRFADATPSYPSSLPTFWTSCPACHLLYEYPSLYKNRNLACPVCYRPFLAKSLSLSPTGTTLWSMQEQNGTESHAANGNQEGSEVTGTSSKCPPHAPPPRDPLSKADAVHPEDGPNVLPPETHPTEKGSYVTPEVHAAEDDIDVLPPESHAAADRTQEVHAAGHHFEQPSEVHTGCDPANVKLEATAGCDSPKVPPQADVTDDCLNMSSINAGHLQDQADANHPEDQLAAQGQPDVCSNVLLPSLQPDGIQRERDGKKSKLEKEPSDEAMDELVEEDAEPQDNGPKISIGCSSVSSGINASDSRVPADAADLEFHDQEKHSFLMHDNFNNSKESCPDSIGMKAHNVDLTFSTNATTQHENLCGNRTSDGPPSMMKASDNLATPICKDENVQQGNSCRKRARVSVDRGVTSSQDREKENNATSTCETVQHETPPAKRGRVLHRGSASRQGHKKNHEPEVTKDGDSATRNISGNGNVSNADVCNAPNDINMSKHEETTSLVDVMDVPDSDFYDFDQQRTEHHFEAGQVWACYAEDDGFPRYYARVHKVLSRQPFKMQYSWLEAHRPTRQVSSWLEAGFSCTCGEFSLMPVSTVKSHKMFSHSMAFERGPKGIFKIYPKKCEIWALYKDWRSMQSQDVKRNYDLVEVMTDYSHEVGVQIAILAKVEGCKCVYQRQFGEVRWVLPEELLSFSHSIPVHALKPGEVDILYEGCLELDPASTPTG